MKISVLIRTLDEERNLPSLFENIEWCKDVVVVDSGSTDRSIEISEAAGARVYHKSWEGDEGAHFTWIFNNVQFENEWVLLLDGDERVTPELYLELCAIAGQEDDQGVVAYYCGRKNLLMGKWLKYSMPPTPVMRFFKKDRIRFERTINTTPVVDGKHGYLKNLLVHHNFSKGISEWVDRHNRYSTHEAIETLKDRNTNSVHWIKLFSFDRATRGHEVKKLSYRLPFRASCKFFYMYVIRGGLLDGRAGFIYCILQYLYEWLIVLKIASLKYKANDFYGVEIEPIVVNGKANGASIDRQNHSVDEFVWRHEMENRMRSPWTFKEKVLRVVWGSVESTLFRYSFHNMYRWRNFLLRLFGAKIGKNCSIRRTVNVYIPWHLEMGDWCTIGDDVILYPLGQITIKDRVMISQMAHLCAGTHDFTRMDMPLLRPPIEVGSDTWICSDVFVGPNVKIGDGCVIGARSSVFHDLPAWQICVGNPARAMKDREYDGKR
ncbi:Putative acetyltransferase [Poriferisphaera corsica]|uniref:Acetyltransferase n=1 Tax=Poriferisphaera corsica TaxID=2528020 RepID=A0A517YPZ3_9BACT|nr:WcaF family extracellular polysaccharide biosynthesis acetyltransferase [Poriferisphaera corsica]QDU32296.1 Putative acetyltransferase [Poriferisphaera corsica]